MNMGTRVKVAAATLIPLGSVIFLIMRQNSIATPQPPSSPEAAAIVAHKDDWLTCSDGTRIGQLAHDFHMHEHLPAPRDLRNVQPAFVASVRLGSIPACPTGTLAMRLTSANFEQANINGKWVPDSEALPFNR